MFIQKRTLISLVAVSVLIMLMASTTWGASSQPGSAADPVVTKSYVDDRINQVMALVSGTGGGSLTSYNKDEIVNEVLNQLELLSDSKYIPVHAFNGDKIIGLEGTEIILRSGKAVGICPGSNGITDATDGKELYNNGTVTINHLLIIPRSDGRGVKVTVEEAWFLIKGGYEID